MCCYFPLLCDGNYDVVFPLDTRDTLLEELQINVFFSNLRKQVLPFFSHVLNKEHDHSHPSQNHDPNKRSRKH